MIRYRVRVFSHIRAERDYRYGRGIPVLSNSTKFFFFLIRFLTMVKKSDSPHVFHFKFRVSSSRNHTSHRITECNTHGMNDRSSIVYI